MFTSSVCVTWASLYLRFFQPHNHSTRIPAVLSHFIHFIFLISESLYECAAGCCQRRNLSAAKFGSELKFLSLNQVFTRCHHNHVSFPPQYDCVSFSSVTLKTGQIQLDFSMSVCVREFACGFGFLCYAPVVCDRWEKYFAQGPRASFSSSHSQNAHQPGGRRRGLQKQTLAQSLRLCPDSSQALANELILEAWNGDLWQKALEKNFEHWEMFRTYIYDCLRRPESELLYDLKM